MKKRVNIITVVVLMALSGLVTYIITFFWVQEDLTRQLDTFKEQQEEFGSLISAYDFIESRFIGEADKDKIKQSAIDGMIRGTEDVWSRYFNPEEFRAHLDLQDSAVGIGISAFPDTVPLRVYAIAPGSPAEAAGLRVGDVITHIDGAPVEELGHDVSVEKLNTAAVFSPVRLTVERPDEGSGSFQRDVMRHTSERVESRVVEGAYGKTGIVRIAGFGDRVNEEFAAVVNGLIEDGVTGLVFDVRNNPGGSSRTLERILDFLLPEGDLFTLRYIDGREDRRVSGPDSVGLPAAVLVNGESAGEAEVFAACLREYGRAVLVGETTAGKGYLQEYVRLADGSGLYLSTSEYLTSKGERLAGAGLSPDVELILSGDERRHIGSMDPALDRQLARAIRELPR
jgi:carboxyl-terminal processing protease